MASCLHTGASCNTNLDIPKLISAGVLLRLQVLLSSINVQAEQLHMLEEELSRAKISSDAAPNSAPATAARSPSPDGPYALLASTQALLANAQALQAPSGTPGAAEEQQPAASGASGEEPLMAGSRDAAAQAAGSSGGGVLVTEKEAWEGYVVWVKEVVELMPAAQLNDPAALARIEELTLEFDEQIRRYALCHKALWAMGAVCDGCCGRWAMRVMLWYGLILTIMNEVSRYTGMLGISVVILAPLPCCCLLLG